MRQRLRFAFCLILLGCAVLPPQASVDASPRILGGFPLLRQQHSLTCESSVASMATRGVISEDRIMAAMPRNPNPNLGFRGNRDGIQGTKLIDYGVYGQPIHQALTQFQYRNSLLNYGTDDQIRSFIDKGWPVVVWTTYQLRKEQPRLAWANGTQFFLVPFEHALLIVGYDANSVIANDPWMGTRVRYDWGNFNRAWGYFARMAVGVEPCKMPQPVQNLRPFSLSPGGITWGWRAGKRAVAYHVRVVARSEGDQVVFSGNQTGTSFTLNNIQPGASYEISVKSVSSCGGTSAVQRVWTQLPASLASPTSTAIEGTLTPTPAPPAATSTPTSTATPAVKPTATSTAKP